MERGWAGGQPQPVRPAAADASRTAALLGFQIKTREKTKWRKIDESASRRVEYSVWRHSPGRNNSDREHEEAGEAERRAAICNNGSCEHRSPFGEGLPARKSFCLAFSQASVVSVISCSTESLRFSADESGGSPLLQSACHSDRQETPRNNCCNNLHPKNYVFDFH